MSNTIVKKADIFETEDTTYDSEEIKTLSLEDVLVPIIKLLDTQIKATVSNVRALREVEDDVMYIMKLASAMELLKMHFEFAIGMLSSNSDEEVSRLKDKYTLIRENYEHVKSKQDLSVVPAKYVVAMLHDKIIAELKKIITRCFRVHKSGEVELIDKEDNIARIRVMTGRLELSYTNFPKVITFPESDIHYHEKSAPAWQELYEMATFKELVNRNDVRSTSRLFHFGVHLSHIIINNQLRNRHHPQMKAVFSLLGEVLYYGVQHTKIETQALSLLLKPDVNEAFKAWNLPEKPLLCRLFLLLSPMIAYDKLVYIPRIFPKITRESVAKEYEDGTINKLSPMEVPVPDLGYDRCAIIDQLFAEDDDKVPVRILSNENLNLEDSGTSLFSYVAQKAKNMIPFLSQQPKETEDQAIIIHMHGGGFVAMTSATHRVYLSRWVKNLKLVHFSIDYRNAPQNKYPAAVDDVWQAYLWITNYATKVLGIKYKKVILVGDSSGATLALALTYRLIRAGLPVPDGMLLFYPAFLLDPTSASPSYFEALDDTLLPYSLLQLIVEAYLDKDCKIHEDPNISPLVASDEILAKLPPIRLITGSKDPLYDDNWRFLKRMKNLNKDIKINVHAHLSHGYICHNLLKNYTVFIDEAADLIRELVAIEA